MQVYRYALNDHRDEGGLVMDDFKVLLSVAWQCSLARYLRRADQTMVGNIMRDIYAVVTSNGESQKLESWRVSLHAKDQNPLELVNLCPVGLKKDESELIREDEMHDADIENLLTKLCQHLTHARSH